MWRGSVWRHLSAMIKWWVKVWRHLSAMIKWWENVWRHLSAVITWWGTVWRHLPAVITWWGNVWRHLSAVITWGDLRWRKWAFPFRSSLTRNSPRKQVIFFVKAYHKVKILSLAFFIYFCFNTVYNIGSNLRSLTSEAIWMVTRLWWAINHAHPTV